MTNTNSTWRLSGSQYQNFTTGNLTYPGQWQSKVWRLAQDSDLIHFKIGHDQKYNYRVGFRWWPAGSTGNATVRFDSSMLTFIFTNANLLKVTLPLAAVASVLM